ncbi:MAG: GNAT family N-acetyltransferase, partial [Acholeplasmatales bacterium]|nr:GNAT family N-acetyltransferase [Acholeplasmatales bacterium]
LKARIDIFVVEQNCPYSDLDDSDLDSYHIMVYDNDKLKAYFRVIDRNRRYEEVSLGRVITLDRGKGYGIIALNEGIKCAKEKYNANEVVIGAQCYAEGFYNKVGFKAFGDIYDEDGIPHIHMKLSLN